MKFAEELFPKGTFPKQQSDGAYIHHNLATNLDIFAKTIVKDMHFLIIITGNDSVGNGKSTLATQVCTYLTWKINQLHGLNNTFTHKNVFFKGKALQNESFNMPKYSVLQLDEGDDLTGHAMKNEMHELKRYFRKCRQLNQILVMILPSFFELPKFFALARSHCLINVKFHGEFQRGIGDFYSQANKKKLYIHGKKDWDYSAAKPNFDIAFTGGYCFYGNLEEEIQKYLEAKHKDAEEETNSNKRISPEQKKLLEFKYKVALMNLKETNNSIDLASELGVSTRTLLRWKEIDLRDFSNNSDDI